MSNTVEFKIKISDISGDAVRNIRASLEGVDGIVEQITQSASSAGGALREAANEAFRWNQVKDVLSGVTDLLNQITAPAQQFNQAMREVNTMAIKGEQDFDRLKSSVRELSNEIPIARDLLARGLYQTISNGVPEDNWISFLDRSAKSAVGGIANLEKVVTVTSTVIKNYGLSWDEAGSIQDKIQTTAKNGVTSFEQLADALPRVSGNAATLGVSIDDLMATFATLTGVSGNTAEVSTQLAAIFTALVKPSSEAAKMARQMGVEFNAASIKAAGGLIPFLENLNARIGDYAASSGMLREEIYGMLFGSAEALRAIIPLTGELGSKFVENSGLIADSAGTIDAAFEQINSTGDSISQRLSNWASGFSDYATAILGTATPYIAFIAQTGIAVTQLAAFANVLKAINMKSFISGLAASRAALTVKAIAMQVATTASNIYKIALVQLTAVFGSARIAAAALTATMTLGLSVAIYAIIEVISRLTTKTEENTHILSDAQQAQQQYKDILTNARAEMKVVIAELAAFNGSKDDEIRKVAELNAKYGESFGYYDTVAKWYDTLSQKSELYCKKLVNEAKIRGIANQIATNDTKKEEIAAAPDSEYDRTIKPSELEPSGDILMQTARDLIWKPINLDGKGIKEGLVKQLNEMNSGLYTEMNNIIKDTSNIDLQLKGNTSKVELKPSETTETSKSKQKLIPQDDELPTWNFDKKVKEIYSQNAVASKIAIEPIVMPIDMQKVLDLPDGGLQLDLEARLKGLDEVKAEIQHLQSLMSVAQTDDEKRSIGGKIKGLQSYADQFEKTNSTGEKTSRIFSGIGNIFSTLSGTVEEGAGAWLNYAGGVISAISQMIPALIAVSMGEATAKAMNLPPPFNFIALGLSLASVAAAFASIPKFADGGIAYGTTLGIFGEYSGAANNPEVVAPLNKLRSLIEPQGGTGGEVVFRIEGRTLVGIINKMNRFNSRT